MTSRFWFACSALLFLVSCQSEIIEPTAAHATATQPATHSAALIPPTAPASATPSQPPTPSIGPMPAFVPTDCRFQQTTVQAECGDLIVPEDRAHAEGPTVSLHVAIFPSYNPDPAPDPVIYLMGGGGGSALDVADYYLHTVGNKIRATRDFILYNQRGTRYGEPFLECPGEAAFRRELNAQVLRSQEADARELAFLQECRAHLLDQGVNLAMYNSVTHAADVEDLRVALGYEQVNLYGTSYGTRLALTVMREHPEGIRSVILDSVFPPLVDYPSEAITSMVEAVDRLFEACSADAACSGTYPELDAMFYQTVDRLQDEPDTIQLGGDVVVVDHHMYLDAIYMQLHPASSLPGIPSAIAAAHQGNYTALEGAIGSIRSYSDFVATGVYYSSLCRDEVNFDTLEHARQVLSQHPSQYADYFNLESFFAACAMWDAGQADPSENEPVLSEIPTLIFAGHFDPITTPGWSLRAAETLSHHFYFEFQNMGHGVMRADPCALDIGLQFLRDPSEEPDAGCLAGLSWPEFR